MDAATNLLRRFPPLASLWRFIESQPLPQAEESIPLRILVQLLVFVGIGATDVAASTDNSIWAIPLSAIGGAWAWYVRYRRNVAVKFCIAIAMITMLVVFLGDIVRQAEETRLLLARLLIQLQVLHSFDLPRRKDLGYSVVIGLILLALAATLSQTTIFGIWLLVFLALSLPFLVLDHRSRLGLSTRNFQLDRIGISPLPMVGLLALVLVLGLAIFALLPRLPGFQLRNFPVSVNMNVQRQIPKGGIVNRSTTQPGQTSSATGNGTDGSGGKDKEQMLLPPLFAAEIDTTKSIQIKPSLVMRVRSQAELFWRVMSYDEYTGKGWRISRNAPAQIRTLRRLPWNYEFYVPPTIGSPISGKEFQEVIQTYTIATENFPNLVPAASVPYRLFFPSEEIDLDNEGSLRAPGPLPDNLTYTVISSVPLRDRTALGQASQDYPDAIRRYYLNVPQDIAPQLRTKALEAIASAKNVVGSKSLSLDNPYEKALFLTQHLKQRYRLQDFVFAPMGGDVTAQFMAQGGGEPTHFVTTLVMMLRSIGIPARYVVGFSPGQFNPFTGLFEVKNTDAKSLVEVYFPDYGWIAFDPVPGDDLYPPSVEIDQTFGVLRRFWNWVAGFLPSPVTGFFTVVFNAIVKFIGDGAAVLVNWLVRLGWAGFIVGLAIAFSLGIALWGVWQLSAWWLKFLVLQKLAPPHRTYRVMLHWLAEKGMPKALHQTPQEYAAWVTDQAGNSATANFSPSQISAIVEITQAYQDWRYGDRASSIAYLKSLLKKLRGK